MPSDTPFAAAPRLPEKLRRIPPAVRAAILTMIYDAADLLGAARAHGLKPPTLRKWLHEPVCIALRACCLSFGDFLRH